MSYTVLARKYRPQKLADLVGQEHIVRSLRGAITSGKVAHAYLFTGVRGVGKTTTARVLAKLLNCQNRSGAPGDTVTAGSPAAKSPPEACGVCDTCREIAGGTDVDVLEIDGASNNSVDDVRRLQESIPFRPARDRFKIIIIDEVHMLSAGAFNALLKTLEEPPSHIIFIFATTELHKVPVTIRSRCQTFEFRLISQATIIQRLHDILKLERIEYEPAAVDVIAREAAGSLRDALTLLDQVIAYADGCMTASDVADALGIAGRDGLRAIASAVLRGEEARVLEHLERCAAHGIAPTQLLRQLLELVRDLTVVRVLGAETNAVALADEDRRAAAELAQTVPTIELERLFFGVSRLLDDVARSEVPQLMLEVGLLCLASRPPLAPLADLIDQLKGGGSVSPRPRADALPVPRNGTPAAPTSAEPTFRPAMLSAAAAVPSAPAAPRVSPSPVSPTPHTLPAAPAPVADQAATSTQRPAPPLPTNFELWEQIVVALQRAKPALAAVLEHASPSTISPTELIVQFPAHSFFADQAASDEAREALQRTAATVLGSAPKITVEKLGKAQACGATIAQVRSSRDGERRKSAERNALEHPRVRDAIEIFAAESVDVRLHEAAISSTSD